MAGKSATSDAETLATLGAAGVEHFAATTSRHSRSKAMGSMSLEIAGLKCSLHDGAGSCL